jgi:hypothetical protein
MAESKSTPSHEKPSIKKTDHHAASKTDRSAAARAHRPHPKQSTDQLKAVAITIDPSSAEIVRIEGLDATGARHELSDEEKASLMQQEGPGDERLAAMMEHAFEAGIACVLGDDVNDEAAQESPTDAELRHLLLAPLIEQSPVRHLTDRHALNRAILSTLIENSLK